MYRRSMQLMLTAALALATAASGAGDRGRSDSFSARLAPTNEVPALSSAASGRFSADIDEANLTISYELTYESLEGTVQQAHIHVGQPNVNGGVSVFLCGSTGFAPPAGFPTPPACPSPSGTVSGVLSAANIIGPNGQGIAPTSATTNEFAELVKAIRDGITYANVHSTKFPGGEIRGQLRRDRGHHRDED